MRPVLAALAVLLLLPAAAAADFYTPPARLPGRTHGDLIRSRVLRGPDAISGGGRDQLVLYRSVSPTGKAIAVSGTVSLPKGRAPKGGWPVVTWAHGTTGIADSCAPSRLRNGTPVAPYITYAFALQRAWLKAGWAVVRTDYEGLGTPGVHPYLIGVSEGRSTLDMVRAARKLKGGAAALSRSKVVIAGHSQGGQAALFAASLAKGWTPELKIRGTVAFAPVSHLGQQGKAIPSISISSLSGLISLIARGIDVRVPSLDVAGRMTARARGLYPQTLTKCLPELGAKSSFGSVPANEIFTSAAALAPVLPDLARYEDPERLRISTPVQIEQGDADTTVLPAFTDALVQAYTQRGMKNLSYVTYPGLTHAEVVTDRQAQKDATDYIRARLR